MSTLAELSSLATRLHELIGRVTEISDRLPAEEQDRIGSGLFEVERTLRAAERRLSRVLD